ncbi:MAG TPA: malectin [Candidatus Acidoferrum sp.]|nr:malectin [Candidatus Acidoferrum sp.]
MKTKAQLVQYASRSLVAALTVIAFIGCRSAKEEPRSGMPAPAAASTAPVGPAKAAPGVIRIRAGDTAPFTDSKGNPWLADQGFADGETTPRAGDLKIENTEDPGLYRAERYSMTAFSYPLSNGKYTVKLHFAETFEGITGPGQRVFSFKVQDREFKDFDIWVKAGGARRAYVETVPVEITNGKLSITFTPGVENPEINGIEIIPGA